MFVCLLQDLQCLQQNEYAQSRWFLETYFCGKFHGLILFCFWVTRAESKERQQEQEEDEELMIYIILNISL